MNKVVGYGLGRKDLRVSGASWIKGPCRRGSSFEILGCFRRNSFYQRGNTNFSSYPNILLLDIVTGDLTDDFLSKTHKFYNFATHAFFTKY